MKSLSIRLGILLSASISKKPRLTTGENSNYQVGFCISKNNITQSIFLFACILLVNIGYSQVNRYSKPVKLAKYEPLSIQEMSRVPMALRKKYNENQEYLYKLKQWILELKPQIQKDEFINKLNGEYSVLTAMEGDDLARATNALRQRENSIREIISEYNVWINQQNIHNKQNEGLSQSTKNQNTPNYNQSKNNSSTNFIQIGHEHQSKGDYAKAIYNYTKQLENDKNNTDVLFLRAICKSELNDNYGAISDYDKIIDLKDKVVPRIYKMSTVYNNKAYCLVGLKNYQEALPFVSKALEMDKSEAYIWDTRGEIYYHTGDYDKCIIDMSKAISIEENDNSFFIRGLAYLQLNQKSNACSDFSKAGELGRVEAYQWISENCN
jgi:tetratricopeptide (TPR) repeat protein